MQVRQLGIKVEQPVHPPSEGKYPPFILHYVHARVVSEN